jgi:hypothetical protein
VIPSSTLFHLADLHDEFLFFRIIIKDSSCTSGSVQDINIALTGLDNGSAGFNLAHYVLAFEREWCKKLLPYVPYLKGRKLVIRKT